MMSIIILILISNPDKQIIKWGKIYKSHHLNIHKITIYMLLYITEFTNEMFRSYLRVK